MAALSGVTHDPTLKAIANRLNQAGKKPKVDLTACMRKLMVIFNTMIKNQFRLETAICNRLITEISLEKNGSFREVGDRGRKVP